MTFDWGGVFWQFCVFGEGMRCNATDVPSSSACHSKEWALLQRPGTGQWGPTQDISLVPSILSLAHSAVNLNCL